MRSPFHEGATFPNGLLILSSTGADGGRSIDRASRHRFVIERIGHMSCATRSTGSRMRLGAKLVIAIFFSLALFVVCSSGSDNGGGSTQNNNNSNNPHAGGASQSAYVI